MWYLEGVRMRTIPIECVCGGKVMILKTILEANIKYEICSDCTEEEKLAFLATKPDDEEYEIFIGNCQNCDKSYEIRNLKQMEDEG